MRQNRSIFCAVCALGLLAAPASAAQAQDGAREALRICTEAEFQAALSGDYAGDACRYVPDAATPDRPSGRDAEPRLAGAQRVRPAAPVGRPSASPVARRQGEPVSRPAPPIEPSASQTVSLDEDFFAGPQAGGVGRDPSLQAGWYYGYRGVILIDASGRSHFGGYGARRGGGVVRRMDGATYNQVRRTRLQRR